MSLSVSTKIPGVVLLAAVLPMATVEEGSSDSVFCNEVSTVPVVSTVKSNQLPAFRYFTFLSALSKIRVPLTAPVTAAAEFTQGKIIPLFSVPNSKETDGSLIDPFPRAT